MLLLSPGKAPPVAPRAELRFKEEPRTEQPHEAVLDLGNAEEARVFLAKEKGLLLLHAPWCGHCKNMMPAFEAAATRLKALGYTMARLQAENAGHEFLGAMGVRGFPTMLGVHNGATKAYEGGRSEDDIVKFVQSL